MACNKTRSLLLTHTNKTVNIILVDLEINPWIECFKSIYFKSLTPPLTEMVSWKSKMAKMKVSFILIIMAVQGKCWKEKYQFMWLCCTVPSEVCLVFTGNCYGELTYELIIGLILGQYWTGHTTGLFISKSSVNIPETLLFKSNTPLNV